MPKIRHRRVLLLLLITPVLLMIELVIGFFVFDNIQDIDRSDKKSAMLDLYLRTNTKYISYAENAQRGYLLTGETKFRDSINADIAEVRKNEAYYDSLPADMKGPNISAIREISARRLSRLSATVNLNDAGRRDSAVTIIKTGQGNMMMDSIRSLTSAIRSRLADQMARERRVEDRMIYLFLALISALIIFTLFMVWYTYRNFRAYTDSLEQAVESLEEANERMGKFTAMSYHELKTPLRNISGFASLLKRRYSSADPGSEEHEFIRQITDGIRQLNQTINDMREKYLDDMDKKKDQQ